MGWSPVVPNKNMPSTRAGDATVPFSLFDGDWLNRAFARLRAPQDGRFRRALKRCGIIVVTLTWVPVALLAAYGGLAGGGLTTTNFFADFAAYAPAIPAPCADPAAAPLVPAGHCLPRDRIHAVPGHSCA
jgi:hypothetical protein